MRSRNIKPGFFKNEVIGELDIPTRLLFIGLWCLADREGRLEYRPKRILLEIFPYDQTIGLLPKVEALHPMVEALVKCNFLQLHVFDGVECLQIANFKAHQHPHPNERPSTIPAFPPSTVKRKTSTIGRSASTIGRSTQADIRNPDIMNPSLIALPKNGNDGGGSASPSNGQSNGKAKEETDLQKVVRGWKMLTNVPIEGDESKAWDKVHFSRCAKSAQSLLALFGDWEKAVDAMEYVYMHLTGRKLSCTIETVVKHSDLYREYLQSRKVGLTL